MLEFRKRYLVIGGITFKFIICICTILLGYNYLNDNKFFIDANTIYNSYVNIPNGLLFKFSLFDGFGNTARIYKIMLLGKNVSINSLFVVTSIIYMLIFIFLIKSINIKTNYNKFITFCFVFVFDAIFLMQPSKDSFGLLFNILIFKSIIKDKKINNLYIAIIMSIYGYI